jgi:protein-S-isoprenylcysteine O-methyltransferase Ste14
MRVEWELGASAIEFRLRMAINVATVLLGFWAPWIDQWGFRSRISSLEWLALELSRTGLLRFTLATPAVIVLGALLAAFGAILRVWGTAYLGSGTVQSLNMKADSVMVDGPFRYVRNPLYLGLWFTIAALTFVMPPTGALVTMILFTIFQFRLIFGEEAYLSRQLGETYRNYLRVVPRLIPRLRTNLTKGGAQPHWLRAVLTELNSIGIFVALAVFSWSYDNRMMVKVILVGFGVSLVMRAFVPANARLPD